MTVRGATPRAAPWTVSPTRRRAGAAMRASGGAGGGVTTATGLSTVPLPATGVIGSMPGGVGSGAGGSGVGSGGTWSRTSVTTRTRWLAVPVPATPAPEM